MGETKKCPMCAETIAATAKKCRFCNEWLDKAARARSFIRWVSANEVEIPPMTSLPMDSCWMCGREEQVAAYAKEFQWVPVAARFNAITSLAARQTGTVGLPCCPPCKSRWRWSEIGLVLYVIFGLFLIPGLLGFMGHLVARDQGAGIGALVGVFGWLVGIFVLKFVVWKDATATCTNIEGGRVTLKFARPELVRRALAE